MAYKVIILYRLYMPPYFLGTFTEYPYIEKLHQLHFAHPYVGGIGRYGNFAAPVYRDYCPFHRLCVIWRNVR